MILEQSQVGRDTLIKYLSQQYTSLYCLIISSLVKFIVTLSTTHSELLLLIVVNIT